ncbi:phosphoribosylaminoimidazolesuccinocarboxamide synthase [candidate division KSB1 bacterium]|nr:phosphoribosylaminoimidazolesuccinocarboxamide synthase [candidate division KSB1 bacterium]
MSESVLNTNLVSLGTPRRGKVRDIYDLGEHLLIVATDRISAFDVVMPNAIPDKGKVLTKISAFWFEQTTALIQNHLITIDTREFPGVCQPYAEILNGRSMLVKKAQPLPVECIVRGYLAGSGWKDYQKSGKVSGVELPAGLPEFSRLPQPIFTPSTKAETGHDKNITTDQMAQLIGAELTQQVIAASLKIYNWGREFAAARGILIADTKFEFGLYQGQLMLIDEVLTPDSARFWPAEGYQPGVIPMSFDKQYIRDYLAGLNWDKTPPGPTLPAAVVTKTRAKYIEAFGRLTGQKF